MYHFINSSRTYPFGKLYPIISSVAQFFVTKIHALASSWHDAANNDDLDGMLSIASLINHFKQSELYYHVSQNDDQVFLSMRYLQKYNITQNQSLHLAHDGKTNKKWQHPQQKSSYNLNRGKFCHYFYFRFIYIYNFIDPVILLR